MILGGAVAGQGETSIVLTIGVVWFGAVAGDSVSFLLGRRLGRDFLLRYGPRVRITHERFARVEDYFARHGGKTIVIGRFIGLVRALAPFIAGSSGMRYSYFLPFSVLGTGLWAADLRADRLLRLPEPRRRRAHRRTGHASVRDRGRRDRRDRGRGPVPAPAREPERLVEGMERRAALRPLLALGRRVAPPARFLWARLTPGTLGLQFTTLLAVLAVAVYLVIAYTVVVSATRGRRPGTARRSISPVTCRRPGSRTSPRSSPRSARPPSTCRWP